MKCATPDCDETLSERSHMLYCTNCRSGMYRADKLGSGWMKKRAKNLRKFQHRLLNVRARKEKRDGR